MSASDTIVDALREQQSELEGLLTAIDDQDWSRPTPCEGWDIADVVLHLAQTNAMAIASARGEFPAFLERVAGSLGTATSADEGAALLVEAERGAPVPELFARWRRSADDQAARLAACDPSERLTWVVGELSARTLATTRLSETWIHTGDVADALGVRLEPPDRLWHVARLAWRTLPYAFARAGRELHGPVTFDLRAPDGERWTFAPDVEPTTVIRGTAVELCLVAGQRRGPEDTELVGEGADGPAVLDLVRTFA